MCKKFDTFGCNIYFAGNDALIDPINFIIKLASLPIQSYELMISAKLLGELVKKQWTNFLFTVKGF